MCAKAGIKASFRFMCAHIETYTYIYTYIYIHTHRCIYIYTYIYFFKIFMQSKPFPSTLLYFCYIIVVLGIWKMHPALCLILKLIKITFNICSSCELKDEKWNFWAPPPSDVTGFLCCSWVTAANIKHKEVAHHPGPHQFFSKLGWNSTALQHWLLEAEGDFVAWQQIPCYTFWQRTLILFF